MVKIIAEGSGGRYTLPQLLQIMEALRSPGGCPWDMAQTHKSIRSNLIEETYINEEILASNAGNHAYPVTVPPGHIFAMGDNRNHSLDSRFKTVDVVEEDSIVGHAIWRFWPFDRINIFD